MNVDIHGIVYEAGDPLETTIIHIPAQDMVILQQLQVDEYGQVTEDIGQVVYLTGSLPALIETLTTISLNPQKLSSSLVEPPSTPRPTSPTAMTLRPSGLCLILMVPLRSRSLCPLRTLRPSRSASRTSPRLRV
jgi:hypothetical protein